MGKHLHEVMGWEGPMTWPQAMAWMEWLHPQEPHQTAEKLDDWDLRVAENARRKAEKEAEKSGGVHAVLKKSDKRTAADLLMAGVSRRQ